MTELQQNLAKEVSAALQELGLHGKVTRQKWLCKTWKTPGVCQKSSWRTWENSLVWSNKVRTWMPNQEPAKHTERLWDHLWLSRLLTTHLEYFPSALHSLMSIRSFQQSAFTNLLTFVSPYSNAMIIISIYRVNDCYSLSQYIQNCLKKRAGKGTVEVDGTDRLCFTSLLNGRFTALKGQLMGQVSEWVSVNL